MLRPVEAADNAVPDGYGVLAASTGLGTSASLQALADAHHRAGDVQGEANCIKGLGDIALARASTTEARAPLRGGAAALPAGRLRAGRGQLHREPRRLALARSAARRGGARPMRRRCRSTGRSATCWARPTASRASATSRGAAHSTMRRARAYRGGPLPLYRRWATCRARPTASSVSARIASCARQHYGGARARLRGAPLFRQVGSVRGEANCMLGPRRGRAQLRSEHDEARARV